MFFAAGLLERADFFVCIVKTVLYCCGRAFYEELVLGVPSILRLLEFILHGVMLPQMEVDFLLLFIRQLGVHFKGCNCFCEVN